MCLNQLKFLMSNYTKFRLEDQREKGQLSEKW